jgi:hypothetical protein
MTMRTIKTTSGTEVALDGDLLAVLESLYRELHSRHGLDYSFEDTMREIRHLIGQMSPTDRETYLLESLFLNSVTYENEKLGAYVRRLTSESDPPAAHG